MIWILATGALVSFGLAYPRLAPVEVARWHVETAPDPVGEYPSINAFKAVRQVEGVPGDIMARLDRIIMATPRTTRIAGSIEDGRITYVTRSKLFGFPDYTTVELGAGDATGTRVSVFGRARFGKSDIGVNKARIRDWLQRLALLG